MAVLLLKDRNIFRFRCPATVLLSQKGLHYDNGAVLCEPEHRNVIIPRIMIKKAFEKN